MVYYSSKKRGLAKPMLQIKYGQFFLKMIDEMKEGMYPTLDEKSISRY